MVSAFWLLTCLGGSKSRHPEGLVLAVGMDWLGFEGVGGGEGVGGQDQLKNCKLQFREQFT